MKAEIKPVRQIMGRLAKGADLLGAHPKNLPGSGLD